MDGCLKCPFICISIFLLVLPLVCSKDEESNGKNDVKESVQNLLKDVKERRQSVDTNAKMSGGIQQGQTNDDGNVPKIKTQTLLGGVLKTVVSVNKELMQEIIQDCGNKYELILAKNDDKSGGSCYLHKMNDRVYQKVCQGIKTDQEIKIDYTYGTEIQNTTLLSSIKGIDVCKGKPVIEMIESSVERKGFDVKQQIWYGNISCLPYMFCCAMCTCAENSSTSD
ncbi:hypothetical protein ACJMK2_012887 [Sinanodonta woodiana]|uniref:Uncharacterized protein n=1 Tax=Sinanodonta woodiana TaxID=1069815 RepID=A0ABD3VCN3_SINWO